MIIVLRLGHRIPRDERISTHVGLVARALGADKMIYSGQKDCGMEESLEKIANEWGGNFTVEYCKNGLKIAKELRGNGYALVHLTMYGMGLNEKICAIKKEKNILIIVGGAHVEGEFFQIADYNIGIGSQPHSEVSALAIFLHEYFGGNELDRKFSGKKEIVPLEKGKKMREKNSSV